MLRVKKIFNSGFAMYYDKVINRLSSFVQVNGWRKFLVKEAMISCPDAAVVVDYCSGGGDVGKFYLERKPYSILINCDISKPLLKISKEKFRDRKNVFFVCSDNRFFPIKDRSIDILFSSFCVRNSPESYLTVEEAKRIVKIGGVWAILDFFKIGKKNLWVNVNNLIFRSFMRLNKIVVPSYSEAIDYLFESIERFYTIDEFKEVLLRSGFSVIKVEGFMGGIASVLIAERRHDC